MKKRCLELETAIKMTEEIETLIRYQRLTVFEISERLKRSPDYKNLAFLKEIKQGNDFSKSWGIALKNSKTCLKNEDVDILKSIGDGLGKSNFEGQISMLRLSEEGLRTRLASAVSELKTKGRLFRSLGSVCGLGIAIILL